MTALQSGAVAPPTPDPAPAGRAGRTGRSVRRLMTAPLLLSLLAALVFAVALPGLADAVPTQNGLLFSSAPGLPAGAVFVGAVLLAVLAFCLAVRRRNPLEASVALLVYIACFRLPVALAAPEPIYGWTYKHLGVVDYIERHGTLLQGIDIYSGWPGVFAAIAWFGTVTGVPVVVIAQWFSLGIHLALAVAVFALCRAFGLAPLTALVGAFVAETANWIGQDYLSPQALTYLLAVILLTLLLRSRERPVFGWLSVPLFAAITVSHQLTPYWLIGITLALGLTRQVRPRYLGLVFALIAGGYLAANYDAVASFGLLSGFDPVANAHSGFAGSGSLGQTLTALAARASAIALWGGAALAAVLAIVRAKRMRAPTWIALVLAFSSFALLAGQNYGGEAIYRVFLYSIPGCALLVAPLVERALSAGRPAGPFGPANPANPANAGDPAVRRRPRHGAVAATLVALLLSAASLQAYYGAWFSNLIRSDSLAVAESLLRTGKAPALILSIAPVGPSRMLAEYADFAAIDGQYDASMTSWSGWLGQGFETTDATDRLTTDLADSDRPIYVFVTSQMADYSDYYGLYPAGAVDRFTAQLAANPGWTTLVDTPTVHLFTLKDRR
ncbi:hypothetical protein E3O44_15135 [Cryobacterium algoricola]|uniref:Glycosyltransferase RgtA/B/C/D-like domain-containing protein n=1 Tax=Cryobacterium algoricola TaxID=1259183 RepID=A0ABY2I9E2_9MICO|nr:hypothetical protein [Cryobacterium algoricola]TFB84418.1 hypothetical protein E3O44_15135 [Cryobacterium algoricola]